MGFRSGAYMKVWQVQPKSDKAVTVQGSVSVKNRTTGEYETKFNEYCSFLGENVATKAKTLKRGDTIRLGDVDVEGVWDANAQKKYYNFKVFSFDFERSSAGGGNTSGNAVTQDEEMSTAYEGISDDVDEEGLPF